MKSILKYFSLQFLLITGGLFMALAGNIPTVGYFPKTFPRDPVDVNIYVEHILIGQILEPLVEINSLGEIVPCVASKWEISSSGKDIVFHIANKKFFNGAPVTAEDVRYSLQRHIDSPRSQSKTFLSRISRMEVLSPDSIKISLTEPYIAFFKALSRDQLGIIPAGWKFDSKSNEPFIGSGPYHVVKTGNGWELIKNPNHSHAETIKIPRWRVLIQGLDDAIAPDLSLFVFEEEVKNIEALAKAKKLDLVEDSLTHFFQSTAWWYPLGQFASDKNRQTLAMAAIDELISIRTKELGLHRSTGVIPEGISGCLLTAPNPEQNLDGANNKQASPTKISVVYLNRLAQVLTNADALSAVEKKFNVKFELVGIDPPDVFSLPDRKPDVFITSFAGGFYDPEGFLSVLPSMFSASLEQIFGPFYPAYLAAASNQDWTSRANAYQELNKKLVSSRRVVPGWRLKASRLRAKNICAETLSLRYTPKLTDFKFQ